MNFCVSCLLTEFKDRTEGMRRGPSWVSPFLHQVCWVEPQEIPIIQLFLTYNNSKIRRLKERATETLDHLAEIKYLSFHFSLPHYYYYYYFLKSFFTLKKKINFSLIQLLAREVLW